MKTNIICWGKGKLMFTDGVLPILMEIKYLFPQANIIFLLFTRKDLDCLKKNYSIWEAFHAIGCTPALIWDDNRVFARLKYFIFILQHLFQRNIFILHIEALPYHRMVLLLLRIFSRILLIRHYHHITSSEGLRNDVIHLRIDAKRKGRQWKFGAFKGEYDYWMSPISNSQYESIFSVTPPYRKMVYTGYVRRLSKWQEFISAKVEENKIVNGSPYFFYVLSCLGKGRLNEPKRIDLLKETLHVLHRHTHHIRTIFKPHPTTNIDQLVSLLKSVRYNNYSIDYAHPMILSAKAKFVIGNAFSTVMNDAHYQGRPIIEYSQRDEELVDEIGGMSTGGRCVDYFINRDQKKLEEVVASLINDPIITVIRDDELIKYNFPPIHQDFYTFWQKTLS